MWGGERSGVAERLREASHRAQPALYPPPRPPAGSGSLGRSQPLGVQPWDPPSLHLLASHWSRPGL